jgi:serine/threonine-protein kinase RsbW
MTGEAMPRCEFEGKDLLVKVDLQMPGDVNAISPVVGKIMDVVRDMGCGKDHEFEIELALREALANAIEHGANHDPTKQIQCSVACDKERGMIIVVRDPGKGFDPSTLPSPVLGQNVFSTGGRGIYLINRLMDEVHWERGGTEIHMRKAPRPSGSTF